MDITDFHYDINSNQLNTNQLEIMTIRKTVNLMMKSSDNNPYSGKLSKKDKQG